MIRKNLLKSLFIFILILSSTNLFGLKYLQEGLFPYFRFIIILLSVAFSVPYFFSYKGGFVLAIQLIGASMIFSIFMAYYSWDQSFFDSLKATTPYLLWFLFFLLLYLKPDIKSVEKVGVIFGLVYILLYFFQLINYKTVYFGWEEEIIEDRGVRRFILPGTGAFFLLIFIALNKLTTSSKNKIFWLLITIAGIVIPFLQATRQFIGGVLVIYLFHFTLKTKKIARILILLVFTTTIYLIINFNDSIVSGITESIEEIQEKGDKYIRVLAGQYFLQDFSPNTESQFFGNGVPYGTKSEYGKFVSNTLQLRYNYYLSDVGLIAVYAMFGLLAVVGYVLIWIVGFKSEVPKEYNYLKYYLGFLLFTGLTSYSIFHYDFLIFNVLVIYSFQTVLGSNK